MRLADWREGWRTDATPHRFDVETLERGDCLVVRTHAFPSHLQLGNCLILKRLPLDDQLGHGRFQRVVTHSAIRRRGLACALVHVVARHALEQWGCRADFTGSDRDGVAVGLYRSLGFRDLGTGSGSQRNAPAERAVRRREAPV